MFAYPLGLLALLGVPAVLGLHLFRRRFRPHAVSALFLWSEDEATPVAGRRRERLRSSPSLWLELLAAALLGLAFAGPKACAGDRAPHLVVVLDASASMGARPPEGATAQAARAAVREAVAALGPRARVSLIASGARPRMLAGPAALASDALDVLDAFEPRDPRHDLEPALALARELVGGGTPLLVTDRHAPETAPAGVEVLAVGRPVDNVALVHAVRALESEGSGQVERALVTVQAFTREAVRRTLVVEATTADGRVAGELTRRELELEPERREHVTLQLPADAPAIRVHLSESDGLALDDAVDLFPSAPRPLALHSSLERETARALFLSRGDDAVGALVAALPDTRSVEGSSSAHLSFQEVGGEAVAGATVPDACWRFVVHTGRDAGRRDLIGPFLADRRHPLLAGTTFEGIVWSIDPELVLPGTPLVSAGNLPILTEEIDGARRALHVNLAPDRTTLARSPDWAILLANLAQERRRELPGPVATNVALGDAFELRGVEPGTYAALHAEGDAVVESRAADGVVLIEPPSAGTYAVRRIDAATDDPAGAVLARFAVQFQDASESDLRARSSGTVAAGTAAASLESDVRPLEAAAGALVLALVLLNWWVLTRLGRKVDAPEVGR